MRANPESFLLGHAQAADWQDATTACLQQLGEIPPTATIGFLYATDTYADALPAIYQRLRIATGVTHWTGTVGLGICATGQEYHRAPGLVVMIANLPEDSFRILPFYGRAADRTPASWDDWLRHAPARLAVLNGDPGNGMLPELLKQLDTELDGPQLAGGLSSSRTTHPQIADGTLDDGLSGVVFNDTVNIAAGLTQGCSPIAGQHVITDCNNNIINSIDGRPALDVLNEDIGEILARDLRRAAGYIFAGLPVDDADSGDYLVRNLVGVDIEGKRVAIGDLIHPGQKLRFCRRDGHSAWEDMQRMLDALKARTGDTSPRGGLYYSCVGRGEGLFGPGSAEVCMIRDTLGDFPLAGFFGNGEIFNRRLYGYTGVLVLFL
ncbi:MAG: FIST signal transduction protein [Thiogranum sp.]